MAQPAIKHVTEAEYLAFERVAEDRHEFYKGEIFLMSGASFKHNVIEDNLRVLIGGYLKGKKCRSFGSNLRIHIPKNTLYTYPDILIVCDKPAFADNEFDTLLNPNVIIEILSPSTGNYDRGAKFDLYREIDTLQEYILVDSTTTHCIHYIKNTGSTWILSESKHLHDTFEIATIGLQLKLSDVYAGIEG
ncbi:MAG: Uma2 family endonuclease [Bacteroidota bacterium]|nr:Uma2 family endonuclease [Bacteroidota bacterium]